MSDPAVSGDLLLLQTLAGIFDECRLSHALNPRKLKELASLRSSTSPPSLFFPAFTKALAPLLNFSKRIASSERVVRFVSAFAAKFAAVEDDVFLEEFLRFLVTAASAANRTVRFRACQIISEIIMRLPDDAEVSDEIWDEVIDGMKERVEDKVPAVRGFAVHALSRFANDGENGDIVNLFIEALPQESNAVVRKTIVLSLPPFNNTCTSIVASTLDVSESVRRAAYSVLARKFPLQSLSIKLRTTILQRGLSDRSASVTKECLKMLKDEWLMKCCGGDPVVLLRFLDVETYESVGEAVMEALLKEGVVRVQEGQSIRQYLPSDKREEDQTSSIKLMEAEVALYWKSLCRHLQSVAQAKGSDAATTSGTEAIVYASEASDNNDLLDGILPPTVSDYVDLVKTHLSAGPSYRFASRQLLLLGAMLDFSDTTNRMAASSFVQELLLRAPEYEAGDDGDKILIGDGISLGGDKNWAKAVSELARKVHASVGEFEAVFTSVIEELARPCRERTADLMQWMHCLSVTGLLLENIASLYNLRGKSIEPSEIRHSLLLPAAKQIHIDVQRVACRCLCLFGMLEKRPSEDLVKQLRLSLINGPAPVSIMASKALLDLVTWHGPQELDQAIGLGQQVSNDNEKTGFVSVNLSDFKDDMSIGVLDLMYSGLDKDDSDPITGSDESDDQECVRSVLGEGFAKILLLDENYPSISSCLHPLILCRLVKLYFSDETNDLLRLKQCLSVFFEHFPALSQYHKKCVSSAFVPVIKSMWPGIYGNPGGSSVVVFRLRKRAIQAARFMLQMMQMPLFSNQNEEQPSESSESPQSSEDSTLDSVSGEEGLAIRIAAEVVTFPDKKTAAGKAYILALCRIAVLIQFRPLEQEAVKCMRGLLNGMITSCSSDKELVKELNLMAARLKSLDKNPEQELSNEQASALFGKLGLDENLRMDTFTTLLPPTPAPRSTRAPPRRRAVRHESSSDEDNEAATFVPAVPPTPSLRSVRSQRASKTVAMSKMTNKTTFELSDEEIAEESDVTSDDNQDEDSDNE